MKLLLTTTLFIIYSAFAFSQDLTFIQFNNKPAATYYLNNPTEMLSQKALDRRSKYAIGLKVQDVPVEPSYINQVKGLGIVPIGISKWFNGVFAWCTENQIELIETLPFINEITSLINNPGLSPNIIRTDKFAIANSKDRSIREPLDINMEYTADQINQIHLNYLHNQGFTGTGITIAVFDNGFPGVNTEEGFAYIRDHNQIKGGYNFVKNNTNLFVAGNHGEMVLSTMGGYLENEFIGTAIDADFYLFVTENNTREMPDEEINWIMAAERADSIGVDIINSSLGYYKFDDPRYNYTYSDMDGQTTFVTRGAQIAAEKGIMVVNAAGNSGNKDWHYIIAPADAKDVFTIGGVDSNGMPAGFSSYGPTADNRIKPDVDALGLNATILNYGSISTGSGTSFASPIMAGAMACLIQAFPNTQPGDLRQKVRESANLYNNPTDQMGYGIPNFHQIYTVLSTKKVKINHHLLIYPNPTSNLLNIQSENPIHKLRLISFEGKLIREYSADNQLDISALPEGNYILKVELENGENVIKKILKN